MGYKDTHLLKDSRPNQERIIKPIARAMEKESWAEPAIERGEELRRNTRDEFQADPETHHENDEAPSPDGKESKD